MQHAPPAFVPLHIDDVRRQDRGGTALFCALSGAFLSLFAFVLWYCPRHL
jgi:hypothetical protein